MEETRRELALKSVRALGLARSAWVSDYYRTKPPRPDLEALADEGLLLRARVDGWKDPVYIHHEITGEALSENIGMQQLMRRFGGTVTPSREAGMVDLRLALDLKTS